MIKRLYEEYDVTLETIILKEYKRLKLTTSEMNVLLAIMLGYKKKKTVSIASICKKVDYTAKEVGEIFQLLIDKNFLGIELENKDHKQREIINLDGTFVQIEDLLKKDIIERKRQENSQQIGQVIRIFEDEFNRVLLPNELDRIRLWFEQKEASFEMIHRLIQSCKKPVTIQKIDRLIFRSQEIETEVVDEKTIEALERLYKRV